MIAELLTPTGLVVLLPLLAALGLGLMRDRALGAWFNIAAAAAAFLLATLLPWCRWIQLP